MKTLYSRNVHFNKERFDIFLKLSATVDKTQHVENIKSCFAYNYNSPDILLFVEW